MTTVTALVPLCACPLCGADAIVELTPEQRLAQPDDTTHVCHPGLGGCNHGFTDDRTRPNQVAHASYGWIIERETVTDAEDHRRHRESNGSEGLVSRKGWTGPRNMDPAIEARLKAGEGRKFRMYDDDGNLYYSGRYLGPDETSSDDEEMFGPLNDLGTPDAGAVRIDYQDASGKWVTL